MTDPIINKGPAIGGPINGQTLSSDLEKVVIPVANNLALFPWDLPAPSFDVVEYVWSPFGAFWNYKK